MHRLTCVVLSAALMGLRAMSASPQDEGGWCFGFETTEGLATGWGQGSDDVTLALNEKPEYVSEGKSSVRLSARSREEAKGNQYVSLIVPVPRIDLAGKMITFDAWTSLPDATKALYVRVFNTDNQCVASWLNWSGVLGGTRTHQFELQVGLSLHGLTWEQKVVRAPEQPVARLEFIIGTNQKGAEYDLYVDNLCIVPSKYRGFADVKQPNPRYSNTNLTTGGTAAAVIVRPEGENFNAPVQRLLDGIRERSGAELPVETDAEARKDLPAFIQRMSTTNVILIGNIHKNRAMLPLYARGWCFTDAVFPGQRGYELRTVHDPWGTGKNVVVIGATDAEGASTAVEALLALLPVGRDLSLGPTVKVQLTGEAARRWGKPFEQELGETFLQQVRETAEKRIRSGAHGGLAPYAAGLGEDYALTGRDDYARAFVWVVRRWKEHHDTKPATYGGPWGMDADFSLYRLIPAWDIVEESPALSDQDRLDVIRILFEFITTDCVRKASGVMGNERVRHNHQTFPALGLFFAGEYFSKHYNIVEAQQWLEIADACFSMQAKAFKPYEDCNGYQWLTLGHLVRYALAKPDFSYFENGNARKDADYAIMCMDNLGYQVTYGDTGSYTGWWSELPFLRAVAWYYNDPGYRWAAARKQQVSGRVNRGEYIASEEGELPTNLLGAKAFPLDPYYYKSFGGPEALPLEKAVDKVVMRNGFQPEDQYLLLDGLSNGGHKHYDGNSISRWTENGRIWLADADYIKSLPKYHNGVLILRDGSSQMIPGFCELEHIADFPRTGLSTTTLRDYAGADWRRHIIWPKGIAFIVADQICALEGGSFSFRPIWQTVGNIRLAGNGMVITQQGQYAAIVSPATGRAFLRDDPDTGKNWSGYKYADEAIVRVLQQVYDAQMTTDQYQTLFTVLRASGEQIPNIKVSSPSEGILYADIDGTELLAGVIPPGTEAHFLDLAIEAEAFVATTELMTVFGLRNVTYAGQTVSTDEPVDIELDLRKYQATISAENDTLAYIPFVGDMPVKAGTTQIDLPREAETLSLLLADLLQQAASLPDRQAQRTPIPKDIPSLQKVFNYREKLAAYLLTGNAGAFEAIDAGLQLSCGPQPLVRNVFAGQGNEPNSIENLVDGKLLSTRDSVMWDEGQTVTVRLRFDEVYDISAVNIKAWHATSSSKGKTFQIGSIRLEGSNDGFKADRRILAEITDSDPHPNWGGKVHRPHTYALADLKARASDLRLTIVPRKGDQIQPPDEPTERTAEACGVYLAELEVWGTPFTTAATEAKRLPAHTFRALAVADVDADGTNEVIAGSSNGKVYLFAADGTLRWSVNTGGEVNSVAAIALAERGLAIVAGSSGGLVTALRPDGSQLWTYQVPYYKRTPHVRTVFGANLGGAKPAVITGCDNWRYYALDASGKELWHYESVHGSTAGMAGDVDGDGRDEIACGTEYYWWHLVSAEGKRIWQYSTRTGPTANAVAMGDLNGDGKKEVLFGGADANVHVLSSDGKLLWKFNTGDEVTGLECADIDGDGRDEVLVSSLSFNVYALEDGGKRLWRQDLGSPVLDLCLVGEGAKKHLCALTLEGRVFVLKADSGDWVGTFDLGAAGLRLAGTSGRSAGVKLAASSRDGSLCGLSW